MLNLRGFEAVIVLLVGLFAFYRGSPASPPDPIPYPQGRPDAPLANFADGGSLEGG